MYTALCCDAKASIIFSVVLMGIKIMAILAEIAHPFLSVILVFWRKNNKKTGPSRKLGKGQALYRYGFLRRGG